MGQGVGSFEIAHDKWLSASAFDEHRRNAHEHRCLCWALQFGAQHVGINVKRSTAFASTSAAASCWKKPKDDPSRPRFERAQFSTGEYGSSCAGALSVTFRAFVAAELVKETVIENKKRKAQEARDLPGKGKAGGKGSRDTK